MGERARIAQGPSPHSVLQNDAPQSAHGLGKTIKLVFSHLRPDELQLERLPIRDGNVGSHAPQHFSNLKCGFHSAQPCRAAVGQSPPLTSCNGDRQLGGNDSISRIAPRIANLHGNHRHAPSAGWNWLDALRREAPVRASQLEHEPLIRKSF